MEYRDNLQIEEILMKIHRAMLDCGYEPSMQFANYILSEDPTYIPEKDNARGLIRNVDRDDLLRFLISHYFDANQ